MHSLQEYTNLIIEESDVRCMNLISKVDARSGNDTNVKQMNDLSYTFHLECFEGTWKKRVLILQWHLVCLYLVGSHFFNSIDLLKMNQWASMERIDVWLWSVMKSNSIYHTHIYVVHMYVCNDMQSLKRNRKKYTMENIVGAQQIRVGWIKKQNARIWASVRIQLLCFNVGPPLHNLCNWH